MKVIKLCSGPGNGVDTACLMTASNMLIGKGYMGDEATCQCSLIRKIIIHANDSMLQTQRNELLGPLVFEILGTKNSAALQRRARFCLQWMEANGLETKKAQYAFDNHYYEEVASLLGVQLRFDLQIKVPKLILDLAAIGDKRPVEPKITEEQLCKTLSKC